jgi:hypothetical protein
VEIGGSNPLGVAVEQQTVVYGKPPVWDRAVKELGANENTVFTYGKTVYVPSGNPLSPDLQVHEAIHSTQQGEDPAGWWEKYFADAAFRVEQELYAYQHQYRFFCGMFRDRNVRARFARQLAGTLAGTLYGRPIDFSVAYQRITGR